MRVTTLLAMIVLFALHLAFASAQQCPLSLTGFQLSSYRCSSFIVKGKTVILVLSPVEFDRSAPPTDPRVVDSLMRLVAIHPDGFVCRGDAKTFVYSPAFKAAETKVIIGKASQLSNDEIRAACPFPLAERQFGPAATRLAAYPFSQPGLLPSRATMFWRRGSCYR